MDDYRLARVVLASKLGVHNQLALAPWKIVVCSLQSMENILKAWNDIQTIFHACLLWHPKFLINVINANDRISRVKLDGTGQT
jgi:hypothetical protein